MQLYQCPKYLPGFPGTEVPRKFKWGRDQQGSGNRRYHDDDGCRLDYRRYAGKIVVELDAKGRPAGSLFDSSQPGPGQVIPLHP